MTLKMLTYGRVKMKVQGLLKIEVQLIYIILVSVVQCNNITIQYTYTLCMCTYTIQYIYPIYIQRKKWKNKEICGKMERKINVYYINIYFIYMNFI